MYTYKYMNIHIYIYIYKYNRRDNHIFAHLKRYATELRIQFFHEIKYKISMLQKQACSLPNDGFRSVYLVGFYCGRQ